MREHTTVLTASYDRRAKKFFKKHPELISQYEKCLLLMELDPVYSSLRLHPLKGKLKGFWTMSINIAFPLTIELIISDKESIPVNIDTHDQVYS